MHTKTKRRGLLAVALVAASGIVAGTNASASHPEVSLPGSNFEIDTDANLRFDDAPPSEDWASVPQGTTAGTERRKADLPPGNDDDSFGEGTKEDDAVPTVVDGGVPPNKSDLTTFGGYLETNPAGDRFLNIYWHRVQDPSGTTNMDFEFNKLTTLSANGVTPVRSAGDALIQYDLTQGGTNPQLFLSRWVTSGANSQCEANGAKVPCWNDRVNLTTAGLATGSINTSAIPAAEADGLGAMSARTFGEAQIDFDALAGGGGGCVSFGSAYLKSRSSDSFTAALKDFIAPLALNFDICGDIVILKTDDATPGSPLNGAQFDLRTDNAPVGGSPGAEDITIGSCTTAAGTCGFTDIAQGEYWVVETVAPAGHDLANPAFQHVTVVATETVTVTFVDPRQRGAILLTKTRKHFADGPGPHPHPGVGFTIAGTAVTTNANGQACVDGLLFGSYDVVETVPAGYVADGATTKSVVVNNNATCAAVPYLGETVSFGNTPKTNVTVSVDSQVDGGTATVISCTDNLGNVSGTTVTGNGDGSHSVNNLLPTPAGVTTLTCTFAIDP